MAFTYLPATTNIGKIRLMLYDTNPARYVFEDEEYVVFLSMEASRIKRAAALALETMASNEAFVLKAISTLELTTDGTKVSAELRARAKVLRQQDADDLAVELATDGEAGFEIAEWPLGNSSYESWRARLYQRDDD